MTNIDDFESSYSIFENMKDGLTKEFKNKKKAVITDFHFWEEVYNKIMKIIKNFIPVTAIILYLLVSSFFLDSKGGCMYLPVPGNKSMYQVANTSDIKPLDFDFYNYQISLLVFFLFIMSWIISLEIIAHYIKVPGTIFLFWKSCGHLCDCLIHFFIVVFSSLISILAFIAYIILISQKPFLCGNFIGSDMIKSSIVLRIGIFILSCFLSFVSAFVLYLIGLGLKERYRKKKLNELNKKYPVFVKVMEIQEKSTILEDPDVKKKFNMSEDLDFKVLNTNEKDFKYVKNIITGLNLKFTKKKFTKLDTFFKAVIPNDLKLETKVKKKIQSKKIKKVYLKKLARIEGTQSKFEIELDYLAEFKNRNCKSLTDILSFVEEFNIPIEIIMFYKEFDVKKGTIKRQFQRMMYFADHKVTVKKIQSFAFFPQQNQYGTTNNKNEFYLQLLPIDEYKKKQPKKDLKTLSKSKKKKKKPKKKEDEELKPQEKETEKKD